MKEIRKGSRKNSVCTSLSSLRVSYYHETVTYQHHLVHLRKFRNHNMSSFVFKQPVETENLFFINNLNNFPNEPGVRLKIEFGNILINSPEEEIIVWFWQDNARK